MRRSNSFRSVVRKATSSDQRAPVYPAVMTWSRSGLPTYLYGYRHHPRHEQDGSLTIVAEKVTRHVWGTKEIPSGFFDLPEAENVSAVLYNSSGTISKFDRIGVVAGSGQMRSSQASRSIRGSRM